MVEQMMIDLRALLVEREDCDAGTVQKIREALAQGGNQYRSLRETTDILRKKVEAATGVAAKRWQFTIDGDNWGTKETGEYRVGGTARWTSPFGIGDNMGVVRVRLAGNRVHLGGQAVTVLRCALQ